MAMIRSAPSCLAARTAISPTAPSPTTATVLPGPACAASAANQPVPSTSEAASSAGIRSGSGWPGVATRVPSACGIRAFVGLGADRPATNEAWTHLDWKPAWQISQVLSEMTNEPTTKSPTLTVRDLAADLLDHPDVLVAHQEMVGRLHAAVGPQVGPADAGRAQPHDRIGRLDDRRVLAVLHAHVTWAVHDHSTHCSASLIAVRLFAVMAARPARDRVSRLRPSLPTPRRQASGTDAGRPSRTPPIEILLHRVGIDQPVCSSGVYVA